MDQKVFEMVTGSVETALNGQGFRKTEGEVKKEEGREVLFLGEGAAYSVLYQENGKRFTLRTCDMDGEEPNGQWKTLSMWLYDPDTDTPAQAQSIVEDFTETLTGPKQTAAVKARKNAKRTTTITSIRCSFSIGLSGCFPN